MGKTDRNWIGEGFDLYRSRLRHYVSFSSVEIPELKNVSSLTREQIKEKEGLLVLKNLKDGDEVILLDEKGREYTSGASGLVSLSRMTFSHQMVRTIFAEQLYRAFTIIKGEPYHHE